MSGPYPPPGYPPPQQPGWGDQQWYGQQPPAQQQPPRPPQYDFPTVQYGGLTTPPGSWGEPPRRKRNTGRLVLAVISVLVIIGGVVTAALVLTQRHTQQNATPPTATHTTAPPTPTTTTVLTTTTADADPGVPNGSTTLNLPKGACVSAQAIANNQYQIGRQVTCGTAQSDLVLAVVSPAMTGCPDHQFLRVSAPSSGVYCFTLDVKRGDCLDNSFLKAPCTPGAFTVLSIEAGPGSDNSCTTSAGATHWVPIGHDPVSVACIGPAKTS